MPNHEVHSAVTRAIFGPEIATRFSWVDKELDRTAATTGPTHRSDNVHTVQWVISRAAAYYQGEQVDGNYYRFMTTAAAVAQLHIETDLHTVPYRTSQAITTLVGLATRRGKANYYPNKGGRIDNYSRAKKALWAFQRLNRDYRRFTTKN